MAESKTKQFMVNIEPTLNELLQRVLNEEDESASAYLRSLLMRDLVARGLLTEKHLLVILGVTE
jgi:hypothetical protein